MSKRKSNCNNNLNNYWRKKEKNEKNDKEKEKEKENEKIEIDLGFGSDVIYLPTFIHNSQSSWDLFSYLSSDHNIPWSRPTIRVYGRTCLQPRDTCYMAFPGLAPLKYSGYTPPSYPLPDFPPLMDLLSQVEDALPGTRFNSLLLNRYNGGNDYVGWHSDDESLYGSAPVIASLSLGTERPFFLRKKPTKDPHLHSGGDEGGSKQMKSSSGGNEQHSFTLKHGSLLVMRGFTQRDWIHSVPKRAKLDGVRINLTFRLVL